MSKSVETDAIIRGVKKDNILINFAVCTFHVIGLCVA